MLGKVYSPLIYSVSLNLSQVLVSCVGSNFVNVCFPRKKGRVLAKLVFQMSEKLNGCLTAEAVEESAVAAEEEVEESRFLLPVLHGKKPAHPRRRRECQ